MSTETENEAESSGDTPTLRIVTGDLFLGETIAGYGRAAGYRILPGPRLEPGDWARLANANNRMIINLATPAVDWQDDFEQLPANAKQRVAAYAPHVKVGLLKQARSAGIPSVFTHSQLNRSIPRWLTRDNQLDAD